MPISTILLHLCSICLIILGISINYFTLAFEWNDFANLSAGLERGFCKTPGAQIGVRVAFGVPGAA